MGADNQAERVIARIEFREHLAEVFHRAWRRHVELAPPWNGLRPEHRAGTLAGIKAVIEEINQTAKP